ncbi:hypothetical protein ACFV0G_38830, partial [Kitasatospora sp. NPDC059571]
ARVVAAAVGRPPADRPAPTGQPAAADVPAAAGRADRPPGGLPGGALSVSPVVASDADTAVAVLAPIAAGLLLTGFAMYKHRGLPRGH